MDAFLTMTSFQWQARAHIAQIVSALVNRDRILANIPASAPRPSNNGLRNGHSPLSGREIPVPLQKVNPFSAAPRRPGPDEGNGDVVSGRDPTEPWYVWEVMKTPRR